MTVIVVALPVSIEFLPVSPSTSTPSSTALFGTARPFRKVCRQRAAVGARLFLAGRRALKADRSVRKRSSIAQAAVVTRVWKGSSRRLVGYRSNATVRTIRVLWCLRGPAWLLPPTKPAQARPWDRQPGSPAHRSRAHVGSAMGCRHPLAHRPSAARRIRPGPRQLSPNSPPCRHLTLGYSPTLVEEGITREFVCRIPYPRRPYDLLVQDIVKGQEKRHRSNSVFAGILQAPETSTRLSHCLHTAEDAGSNPASPTREIPRFAGET
jgi:hypothetical protein